ncbi:Mg2 transporter protein [Nocardioides sp. PD653]|nr:Mg2 transporter protein [Nocardioides sp. PD653-B2]GAW53475.1 Mg2 transporter protein [Nocardioides sp. PD653]
MPDTDGVPRTRCYRNGVLTDEDFALADVAEHLRDDSAVVWVDLCAPDAADLQLVADELGLHRLAVEDATQGHQRPKVDCYAGHDFLSAYSVRLDVESGELVTAEIAAFITRAALITVRRDDSFSITGLVSRWDDDVDLTKYGVGALVHGLLDFVVDGHFEAVESLDDQIEQLEDLLFDDRPHDQDVQRRSFELRKSLVKVRRVVLPMREVVNTLMRRDVGLVTEELMPYYQDVYDHVLRATEWTESLRDLVNTILETNLTIQGNRLNIITKKVTSWAAIIAVPTAITGFYGQNVPYPGFANGSGFLTSKALIVALSGALFITFKRKDWL